MCVEAEPQCDAHCRHILLQFIVKSNVAVVYEKFCFVFFAVKSIIFNVEVFITPNV